MSGIEAFLSNEDENDIIEAIRLAEKKTTGEIRIHIEKKCTIDAYQRAKTVFHFLKMDNTKQQNGILFYLAIENKTFAIYGDKGINTLVDSDFWDTIKNSIEQHFKLGNFKLGLIDGITIAGNELSKHFPWHFGDKNELDNAISKA